jgi:SAM-dependent methyltransferase
MKLEDVKCYNCGSPERVDYDSENGFSLVRCSGCGLVYLSPRPLAEEITSSTKTGQHRGEAILDVTGAFNDSALPRYRRILQDFFPQGFGGPVTWLDIGSGHGELIVALQEYSGGRVQARGCEPNGRKVEAARSRGLDVDFFELAEHDRRYDYISALNVFSHLPDPVEAIGEWKKLLKPGGSLLLETGHSSHLKPRDHHKPYYLPDHLSFANKAIVSSILSRVGFRVLKTKIYRHTVFPEFNFSRAAKETVKNALGRPNRMREYLPRQPNRDMFILASRST